MDIHIFRYNEVSFKDINGIIFMFEGGYIRPIKPEYVKGSCLWNIDPRKTLKKSIPHLTFFRTINSFYVDHVDYIIFQSAKSF